MLEDTIEINGITYTVRELTIDEGVAVMDLATGEDADPHAFNKALLAACVTPAVTGMAAYMPCVKVAMKLNGMSAGND